ncbi:formate dehydrogenase accessory sulfurtransferase FdhD [Polaribacter sp. Z014]|uniref:formate dehydrogenase accessory sulfurtransferase FdhD n=1 Tax=unclassified Polaribacter TaxID=196858 RepID=UPI00193B4F3F|nr:MULTISPECIES: formate dehydrogenase accessory sulfurtransferase FdhD [unclassified Polaribacter]MCL7763143.1 formate dehydrogenase accessory sulfurtransferase FdhD [Polaribacter sp. Z014]QVY65436.1 formate dehydrogenase accessory sulfurtransferase FdhD [Polaribacter sp. Q13]
MQTITYQALKINENTQTSIHDVLVVEAALQININKEPYTVVMRTPDNDNALIRGLLFAEDIYKSNKTLNFEVVKEENGSPTIINIPISKDLLGKGYLNKRTLLSVSSCGICGKKELKDIKVHGEKLTQPNSFSSDILHEMFLRMNDFQHTFKNSGGSHAAALFNKNHEFLTVKEDIGRHNAVDKVIGDLLIKDYLSHAKYLLVSGRVSYEIVSKAFIAKIPIIVAVSACSSLAVDFAKEFGICLIGFTRDNKMTIYSNPSFIKTKTIYV